jgi:AraC-like DNA-binding protein
MSYSGFRQHFARRTGLAPHQFLLRLRVDRASLRLARTADPIKAIALDSGFAFVESFNRVFRQLKGVAPGEYRRRIVLLTRRSPWRFLDRIAFPGATGIGEAFPGNLSE